MRVRFPPRERKPNLLAYTTYIPEDLEQQPTSRHQTTPPPEETPSTPAPATDAADDSARVKRVKRAFPDGYLNRSRVPELEVGSVDEPKSKLEYTAPAGAAEESGRRLSRPARIAIGVMVPAVVLTGVGMGVVVMTLNNNFADGL